MNTAIQDLNDLARACGDGFPMPATANNGAVFEEPWQAHAFAMTLQLHAKGVFTWPEWATALTREIRAGQVRQRRQPVLHPLAQRPGAAGD
jgi:hypothetical protein